MANSNLPVPQRTQTVVPANGSTSSQPTIIINTPKPPRLPRRYVARNTNQISLGGGALFPQIKCDRKDLWIGVSAITCVTIIVYGIKYGYDWLKHRLTREKDEDKVQIPDPPKVESVIYCVNNAGAPKKVLIPNLIVEGGISVIGGREGSGKTILGHQCAIELARGYGSLVAEDITPQNVIIFDGELDNDDYVERFGNMDIPSNIHRVSDCDFANLKQLASYIKGFVSGLLSPTVIFIDNLVALSLESLTGKSVNEFFRELKKIQAESKQTITFVVVDHIGKAPEGQSLDNSLLAGSANLARFAHNIVIVDKSARGADFRFFKYTKQRKAALPDEVLEVAISEEEYLHFEVVGMASEDDVRNTKTNRQRFGQVSDTDSDEEDETPEEDGRGTPWTDEDTETLRELAATLESPDANTIASMMSRKPQMIYRYAKKNGIELKTLPRGRKPKQKEQ